MFLMLGDDLDDALAELQEQARSTLTLGFAVYEPNGTRVTDANGLERPGFNDLGTTCGKIQAESAQGRDTPVRYVRIGQVERPVLEAGLHIAVCATVPKAGLERGKGWEYECIRIGARDDPAMLGRRYLVYEVPAKSRATTRRLTVVWL